MGCKVNYKAGGGPVYAAEGIPVTQGEGFIPFDQMPGFDLIKQQEGFEQEAYPDPLRGTDAMTVGYGHKLLPEEKGKKYTKEQLEAMYLRDYLMSQQAARENIPGYDMMSPEMQGGFTSQAFQLGKAGQADFEDMISAIDAGDKESAVKEVYNSDWAKQTPARAEYLANVIKDGSLQQAKEAVTGEMLADAEVETGRMIPTGYLNTDLFDEGGKFAPSAIPPLPQSGPIKPETTMERRARIMKDADEQFADAQKIRQGTYRDKSVAGGRGNIVEQTGERADAIRSTSIDPYMAEENVPEIKEPDYLSTDRILSNIFGDTEEKQQARQDNFTLRDDALAVQENELEQELDILKGQEEGRVGATTVPRPKEEIEKDLATVRETRNQLKTGMVSGMDGPEEGDLQVTPEVPKLKLKVKLHLMLILTTQLNL